MPAQHIDPRDVASHACSIEKVTVPRDQRARRRSEALYDGENFSNPSDYALHEQYQAEIDGLRAENRALISEGATDAPRKRVEQPYNPHMRKGYRNDPTLAEQYRGMSNPSSDDMEVHDFGSECSHCTDDEDDTDDEEDWTAGGRPSPGGRGLVPREPERADDPEGHATGFTTLRFRTSDGTYAKYGHNLVQPYRVAEPDPHRHVVPGKTSLGRDPALAPVASTESADGLGTTRRSSSMSRMDSGVALRHAPHTGSYSTEPYPVHALWRADLPPPRCGFDVREDDETVNRLRANRAQISTAQTWRRARERTLREPPGRVS